ncbi:MAG TPA: MinD/ParA family protein [Geminicoccaceae bacterium]|nr:MinD/ParA family protein [Geminicoccaceae bacterium]
MTPRIIAVASGKGGVGKTWLAITLAHTLARAGRRVLLFDGDLGLANVDIQLGLTGGPDLGGVVAGRHPLREAVQRFAPGGFDVIPGRSGSGGLARLPGAALEALCDGLRALAPGYDAVLIDLSAGLEQAVRRLAAVAGESLVVTTDEPTALTDAYAFIKVTRGDGPLPWIAVNMAESRTSGEQTYATLRRVCVNFLRLDPPLAGVVRRGPRVAEAIRRQTPLLACYPSCPAARDVEALARRLTA